MRNSQTKQQKYLQFCVHTPEGCNNTAWYYSIDRTTRVRARKKGRELFKHAVYVIIKQLHDVVYQIQKSGG